MRASRWLRGLAWLVCATAVLFVGFALLALALGGVLALGGNVELTASHALTLRLLVGGILLDALTPHLWVSGLTWLLAVRAAPSLERGWPRICLGSATVCAAWFPVIGAFRFQIWSPQTAMDYVNTLLLMSGGVALALLLPRRLVAAWGPGGLAASGAAPRTAP